MPTYVYETVKNGEGTGCFFELVQSMKDAALKVHPETGEPVRRVIQAPHIAGYFSTFAAKSTANNDAKLDKLGFTKYQRAGDGVYEKRAGKGPDIIKRD